MSAGLVLLTLSLGAPPSLVPPLSLSLSPAPPPPLQRLDLAPPLETQSGWGAFGLTLACELPTAFFGPSCGHLYAGEEAHFYTTGGIRLADLLALIALDRWAFGTPPLYAVIQPRFSRNAAAWPLAYTLDFVLVALWWGTGLYDLVDSFFAAGRHNARAAARRALLPPPAVAPGAEPGLALLSF